MAEYHTFLLMLLSLMAYKLFDELQDESVNNAWSKPFLGLPVRFLNKKNDLHNFLHGSFPFYGWARKWKWHWKKGQKLSGYWVPGIAERSIWYLWLYKPTQQERFPYSSTFLVWLTDGEHFFQFWKDLCIGLAFYAFTNNLIIGLSAWLSTYLVGLLKEGRK